MQKTMIEWAKLYRNNLILVVPEGVTAEECRKFNEYDWENCTKLQGIADNSRIMLLSLDFEDREEAYVFKVVTAVLGYLKLYNYPFVVRSGNVVSIIIESIYGYKSREELGRICILRRGTFDLPCYSILLRGSKETTFYFNGIPQGTVEYVEYNVMKDCISTLVGTFGIFLDSGM